jgi:hypothetical protein
MKKALPDTQNLRIVRYARKFFLLPFTVAAALYALVCRWRECGKSDKVRQEDDALRQSRIRRELRGLPPDHVQPAQGAPDGSAAN